MFRGFAPFGPFYLSLNGCECLWELAKGKHLRRQLLNMRMGFVSSWGSGQWHLTALGEVPCPGVLSPRASAAPLEESPLEIAQVQGCAQAFGSDVPSAACLPVTAQTYRQGRPWETLYPVLQSLNFITVDLIVFVKARTPERHSVAPRSFLLKH